MTPLIRNAAECKTIAVVGDVYRYLATGEDTDGKYALFDSLVPPGGGPPPHVHTREVECFYVLEGEITFTVGDQRIVATAGSFASIPIGMPHAFKNESDRTARVLIEVVPAGLDAMFLEVGVPLPAGATTGPPPSRDEIERLLKAAPKYGVQILPP